MCVGEALRYVQRRMRWGASVIVEDRGLDETLEGMYMDVEGEREVKVGIET